MRQSQFLRNDFKNKKYAAVLILILVLLISLSACGADTDAGNNDAKNTEDKAEPVLIDVSFVGDIMTHSPQIESARTGDGYDFNDNFEYVKKYIGDSDLAVCNLETTFAGKPYTGYPQFSAPKELATAIKNAGFDVAVTANNHILDKNEEGLKKTLAVVEEAGLLHTGTKSSPDDKDYLVTEVNDVKVGIVAATYETSMIDGQRTLNGTFMGEEGAQLVNSFSSEKLDEDLAVFKEAMDAARSEGAQIIIAYFHWGEEYERESNDRQQEIAEKVAGFGADIIFASHPHVLQEEAVIEVTGEDGSRDVPVFYSMGNFLSNQRQENLNNRYTEEGMIAQAKITFDPAEGSVSKIETGYIPTWVNKYYSGGGNKYAIVPLIDDYQSNDSLTESGNVGSAEQARSDIEEVLGSPENIFKAKTKSSGL